jgi:cobalamin biosynthesis protein CobD/CbiB
MAAMALAVGVCLHKPGVYALNKSGRATQAADTNAALRLGNFALFWFVVVAFFVLTALFLIANYSLVAAQFGSVL